VLQCVAVCCSVLQCGAVWCSVLRCGVVPLRTGVFCISEKIVYKYDTYTVAGDMVLHFMTWSSS